MPEIKDGGNPKNPAADVLQHSTAVKAATASEPRTTSELVISPEEFPAFIDAVTGVAIYHHKLTSAFTADFRTVDPRLLFRFPPLEVDQARVQAALRQSTSTVEVAFGEKMTATNCYRAASTKFQKLREFVPGIEYQWNYKIQAPAYTLNNNKIGPFTPYTLFEAMIDGRNHDLPTIAFPEQFALAYNTVTTGKWRGRPMDSGGTSVTYNQAFEQPGSPRNLVIASKGDELDVAFSFFSALGFFRRDELANDEVQFKPSGRVEMEWYSKQSIFRESITDKELLETLKAIYDRRTTPSQA